MNIVRKIFQPASWLAGALIGLASLSGCGGESGGAPSGIGAALSGVRMSTNVIAVDTNSSIDSKVVTLGSSITAIAKASSGGSAVNASVFTVTLKGASLDSEDVTFAYNFVANDDATVALTPASPAGVPGVVGAQAQGIYEARNPSDTGLGYFVYATTNSAGSPTGARYADTTTTSPVHTMDGVVPVVSSPTSTDIDLGKTFAAPAVAVRYVSGPGSGNVRLGVFDAVVKFYGPGATIYAGANDETFYTVLYRQAVTVLSNSVSFRPGGNANNDPALNYSKPVSLSVGLSNLPPKATSVIVYALQEPDALTGLGSTATQTLYKREVKVSDLSSLSPTVNVLIINSLRSFKIQAQAIVGTGEVSTLGTNIFQPRVVVSHATNGSGYSLQIPALSSSATVNLSLTSRVSSIAADDLVIPDGGHGSLKLYANFVPDTNSDYVLIGEQTASRELLPNDALSFGVTTDPDSAFTPDVFGTVPTGGYTVGTTGAAHTATVPVTLQTDASLTATVTANLSTQPLGSRTPVDVFATGYPAARLGLKYTLAESGTDPKYVIGVSAATGNGAATVQAVDRQLPFTPTAELTSEADGSGYVLARKTGTSSLLTALATGTSGNYAFPNFAFTAGDDLVTSVTGSLLNGVDPTSTTVKVKRNTSLQLTPKVSISSGSAVAINPLNLSYSSNTTGVTVSSTGVVTVGAVASSSSETTVTLTITYTKIGGGTTTQSVTFKVLPNLGGGSGTVG